MSDLNEKCLDTFPSWLRSLGEDIETVLAVAGTEGLGEDVRGQLVATINYLFKSLDLIPDGIDDIGYLDDAFVIRIGASAITGDDLSAAGDDHTAAIEALAGQVDLIKEFLGDDDYARLIEYTKGLTDGVARGRSVNDVITMPDVWEAFASETGAFVKGYESPSFAREERNLIKLRAFFDAKLPRQS